MPKLKAYSITRTTEKGTLQNCYITFDGQNSSWSYKTFNVIFNNFESQEMATKQVLRLGDSEPKPIQSRQSFELPLTGNDFVSAMMQTLPEEDKNLPFVFIFSNAIWRMALTTPFISDFIENEDGILVETKNL